MKYQAVLAGLDFFPWISATVILVHAASTRPLRKGFDGVHEIMDFVGVRVLLPSPTARCERVLARTAILIGRVQSVVERLVCQSLVFLRPGRSRIHRQHCAVGGKRSAPWLLIVGLLAAHRDPVNHAGEVAVRE